MPTRDARKKSSATPSKGAGAVASRRPGEESKDAALRRLAGELTQVRAAYARFVPPELLKLLGKEDVLEVRRGDRAEKKMTVLFSDIRGFASLSERMSPEQCFAFVNDYLGFMEPTVQAHGGFIDKYIGDSVMALFPARGDDALRATLGMLAELARFNDQYPDVPDVRIGLGLNSGLLMLGAIGGNNRLDITVVSDAVNLASRVETLTKDYETPILITQHTLNSIRFPADFSIRFVDRVRVRGKHLAQAIYEVFDADAAPVKAAKLAGRAVFEDALAHYHFRRSDAALALFEACVESNPGDTPAAVYRQRCRRGAMPPADEASDDAAVWRPEYLLGRPDFDLAHRAVFDRIVGLTQDLLNQSAGAAECRLDGLIAATLEHFAAEEELMKRRAYPRSPYMEHCQQHRKFREFLETLAADLRADRVSALRLAFRCQFLLLDWFVSHISITDRHLERFLAAPPLLATSA